MLSGAAHERPSRTGDDEALPDVVTLKPRRLKWLGIFLISLGFVAIAAWIGPAEDPVLFWGAGGFFALCAAIAAPMMLGVGARLELDGAGFTAYTLGRSFRRTWEECSAFTVVRVGMRSMVGFSAAQDEIAHPRAAGVARAVTGQSGALPDNFGMSAEGLAELMNAFRARALVFSTPRNTLPN